MKDKKMEKLSDMEEKEEEDRKTTPDSTASSQDSALNEEEFTCGICYELFVDPTTLNCGHSVCRHCLAQWWNSSKQTNCPLCRNVWQGYPKVNVTLRNAVEALFPEKLAARKEMLESNTSHKEALEKFESAWREQGRTRRPINWTYLIIVFSIFIAVVVIIGMTLRTLGGYGRRDMLAKPIFNWTPDDVAVWVGEHGTWAKDRFDIRFKEAGIDGKVLLEMTEEDLSGPPINMTLKAQRKILLNSLKYLNEKGKKVPTEFWEYKETHAGLAMFIMFSLREYPRTTIAYLYLMHYRSCFLPFFYKSGDQFVDENGLTVEQMIETSQMPDLARLFYFVPKWLFAPYYLCGTFAAWHMDTNYWVARIGILHATLMTINEVMKASAMMRAGFRTPLRLPNMAFKSWLMVILFSLFFKLVWPLVPQFIADCIFYWILFISPFDALNRLRERFTQRHNPPPAQPAQQNNGFQINNAGGGWNFNFQWNAHAHQN